MSMADSRLILPWRCRPLPGRPLAPPSRRRGGHRGACAHCQPPRPRRLSPRAPCPARCPQPLPPLPPPPRTAAVGARGRRKEAEKVGQETFGPAPPAACPTPPGDPLSASALTPPETASRVGSYETPPHPNPSGPPSSLPHWLNMDIGEGQERRRVRTCSTLPAPIPRAAPPEPPSRPLPRTAQLHTAELRTDWAQTLSLLHCMLVPITSQTLSS